MTAQLSMFTGREVLGRKQLKGKPIAPIGEGELVLRVQDTRPAPELDMPKPQCQWARYHEHKHPAHWEYCIEDALPGQRYCEDHAKAPQPPPEPTREAVPLMPKCRPDWDPDILDKEGYHALAAKVRELDAERAKGNGWTPPRRRINKRALAHDRKRKAAQKEARQ